MRKNLFVFDSNAIYRLIRETPGNALDTLLKGSTINLAYYELGNALWREAHLLRRISIEEAEKSLTLIYEILACMQVAQVNGEKGNETLQIANEFNLTFYDSAYLVEAKRSSKILITDDSQLVKAAEKIGTDTLSSQKFITSQH